MNSSLSRPSSRSVSKGYPGCITPTGTTSTAGVCLCCPGAAGPSAASPSRPPRCPGSISGWRRASSCTSGRRSTCASASTPAMGPSPPATAMPGGQSTNCKMNQVVLDYYNRGTPIQLYFFPTQCYKQVELELLGRLNTPYNVKDNE